MKFNSICVAYSVKLGLCFHIEVKACLFTSPPPNPTASRDMHLQKMHNLASWPTHLVASLQQRVNTKKKKVEKDLIYI